MKKFLLTFFCIFYSLPSFAQTTWFSQNSGVNGHLQSVSFVNELTGYACSRDAKIIKTTNGGTNWLAIPNPVSQNFTLIYFFNESTGMVGGVDINGGGFMCKTTNGGTNWSVPVELEEAGPRTIFFTSSLVGYVGGGDLFGMFVHKTINGGNTWGSPQISGGNEGMGAVTFTNANTGVAFCMNGQSFRTTNAGGLWSVLTNENSLYKIFSAQFINETTGFNCGRNGYFGKTTNAGVNWSYTRPLGTTDSLNAVKFTSFKVGYIVGEGSLILQTTDGAATWEPLASPSANTLHAVSFPSPQVGYAVGDNGTIIKTITGILTGVTPLSTNVPEKFNLHQNYPNPFNPATKIKFDISSPGFTTIKVFDANGKQIDELFSSQINAGSYEINFSGENLASGVYYYTIESGNFTQTKKMILMK